MAGFPKKGEGRRWVSEQCPVQEPGDARSNPVMCSQSRCGVRGGSVAMSRRVGCVARLLRHRLSPLRPGSATGRPTGVAVPAGQRQVAALWLAACAQPDLRQAARGALTSINRLREGFSAGHSANCAARVQRRLALDEFMHRARSHGGTGHASPEAGGCAAPLRRIGFLAVMILLAGAVAACTVTGPPESDFYERGDHGRP